MSTHPAVVKDHSHVMAVVSYVRVPTTTDTRLGNVQGLPSQPCYPGQPQRHLYEVGALQVMFFVLVKSQKWHISSSMYS